MEPHIGFLFVSFFIDLDFLVLLSETIMGIYPSDYMCL